MRGVVEALGWMMGSGLVLQGCCEPFAWQESSSFLRATREDRNGGVKSGH